MVITYPEAVLGKCARKEGIKVFDIALKNLSVFNPFVLRKLVNVYKANMVDTVVLNLSRDLKCGGISAQMAGVKNIIFRRGSDRSVRNYFINRYLYQKVVTGILTNSQATKKAILSNGISLVDPDKITVIPNGIDTQKFLNKDFQALQPKKILHCIGSIGKVGASKEFYVFDSRGLRIKKRCPFQFLIGGKGSQETILKSLIDKNNLMNVFHFLGFLDNPKDLLMSSDVFLLPSLWEGLDMSLLRLL